MGNFSRETIFYLTKLVLLSIETFINSKWIGSCVKSNVFLCTPQLIQHLNATYHTVYYKTGSTVFFENSDLLFTDYNNFWAVRSQNSVGPSGIKLLRWHITESRGKTVQTRWSQRTFDRKMQSREGKHKCFLTKTTSRTPSSRRSKEAKTKVTFTPLKKNAFWHKYWFKGAVSP